MDAQMPLGQKVAKSNHVLWNDGDLSALEAEVKQLIARL
jgi:dephospho-CoA kinase